MHIIGTAGHVDHGKSSLVAALTGTHPDRWREEQERGMTLDLGFAHLRLESGDEAGIVDVPGHERFLHNMLAGAAGMELLLLVVAANEGMMPQSREHLQILTYLNVRRTLVVLTKCDLVSVAELAQMRARLVDALRGTLAQGAPILALSSVTGEGLAELRAQIADALRDLPARERDAPVYLPIDRSFTLPGRGTIITGTLIQGSLAIGDALLLEPQGRPVRVRSLQVFNEVRERIEPGARVALNLSGISYHEVARGDVIVSPQLQARSIFDVRFTPLEEALPLPRRRIGVRAYLGAAEILGTLSFEVSPTQAREVRAQLSLRKPTVGFPGLRFVLRRLSPKTLLGGGVLDGFGEVLAGGRDTNALEGAVLGILRERGFQSVEPAQAAFLANLREEIATASLERLVKRGALFKLARPLGYIDAMATQAMRERTLAYLQRLHAEEPWALGATSLALARALAVEEALLLRVLALWAESGVLRAHHGYYALLDHDPKPSPAQAEFFAQITARDAERGFVPCAWGEVLSAVKASPIPGITRAFDTLLERGELVRVGDDLYTGAQMAQLQARLVEYLNAHARITMAQFRDLLGSSRKYAVPLLEWLDAHGVTMREGDERRMRRP